MPDCVLVGPSIPRFPAYVEMVRRMGRESGAFRDLNLAFVDHRGEPRHCLDLLNCVRSERSGHADRPLHNMEFLWPTITYLGTFLHRRGFTFDYVNLFQQEKEALRDKLRNDDVRSVAVTTTLYVSVEPIVEIVSFVRQHNPRAKIIVGGPFVFNQAQLLCEAELLALCDAVGADYYVVSAEGESTLVEILRMLRSGREPDGVHNVIHRQGRTFRRTPSSAEVNPIGENVEDYRLFPRQHFGEFLSIRTAKSCPFSCAFCGFPQRAGRHELLTPAQVERQLDAIAAIGSISTLTIVDDTFNVPGERFKQILRMMIRNEYRFKWNCYLRCDHVDEESIDLMAKSGCEGVFLGLESGSDRILARMNKGARSGRYLRAIPLLKAAGILTHANVIVGFPGETTETVRETAALIEETRPDYWRSQLWYCDPTTPIWDRREEFRIRGSAFHWSHETMDSSTASDLVEELFLTIEGSTWLPQHGFEAWSLYYLQRKGMSKAQIQGYVAGFNALVKSKLTGRQAVDEERRVDALLARLGPDAAAIDAERPRTVDTGAVDAGSGRGREGEAGPARADEDEKFAF